MYLWLGGINLCDFMWGIDHKVVLTDHHNARSDSMLLWYRKKDALWDRLVAILQIVNETIVILLLTVWLKFSLPLDMS